MLFWKPLFVICGPGPLSTFPLTTIATDATPLFEETSLLSTMESERRSPNPALS